MSRMMMSTLVVALAAGTIGVFSGARAHTPLDTDEQAPGYYRMRLGSYLVTVLSDGTAPRDLPKIMSNPDKVHAAYAASHEQMPVDLSINCYLVDTGEHRILIDTGAGELFGPGSGALVRNMRAAGYEPDQIDVVLLTHIHGDHSGGLTVAGSRVFPNATVWVDKRDPALWLSRDAEAKVPKDKRKTFEQSRQTVEPYVTSGQLRTFDGETQLYSGVTAVPERGHTPGMSGYMIESEGERLFLWGDIIHAAEVQFADPSVTIDYDVSPSQAAATRERVLTDASREGYLVGGSHLSFPGLGHVRKDAGRFAFAPLPYRASVAQSKTR